MVQGDDIALESHKPEHCDTTDTVDCTYLELTKRMVIKWQGGEVAFALGFILSLSRVGRYVPSLTHTITHAISSTVTYRHLGENR